MNTAIPKGAQQSTMTNKYRGAEQLSLIYIQNATSLIGLQVLS